MQAQLFLKKGITLQIKMINGGDEQVLITRGLSTMYTID